MELILPKSKKAREKFDRIITAADNLFYERGYHKASVADITAAAEVAVGTFYLYFPDKLSLYHYILFDYQNRIKHYINDRMGNAKSRREKERVGLMAWLEFVNNNPHTYGIIWQSIDVDKSLFVDYYKKFSKSYEKGLIKDQDQLIDMDYEDLSLILMGISSFLGLKVMLHERRLSQDEIESMADSMMKIFYNGLFTL